MISKYRKEVIGYICEQESTDSLTIALQKSPFQDISSRELAAQIKGRQVARKKYPYLLDYHDYRYPVKISLEQASSALTAHYKTEVVGEVHTLVDLTGGMGIDTYHFSKIAEDITYVESNLELCELAQYNFSVLDRDVNVVCESAENFLSKSSKRFDVLYIDPSRRVAGQKKTSMHNLVPNVVDLQDVLLERAERVMIKLSPMQDIKEIIRVLQYVTEVHVVAVDDEVKELLVIMEKNVDQQAQIFVVILGGDEPYICPIVGESDSEYISEDDSIAYLYQPHAAFTKANASHLTGNKLGLKKLSPNSHIYSHNYVVADYPGRIFKVKGQYPLKKKIVTKVLAEKKANIISKNFPLNPSQIAKKLGITEGGEDYLLATTIYGDSKVVFHCERIK